MFKESLSLPYDLDDLQLLGDHIFAIGVPMSMPNEFKIRVFAAAKSYILSNKSVDYTLKKYGKRWDFTIQQDDPEMLIYELCLRVKQSSAVTISYLISIPGKPDLPNVFACTAAILRLKNSFKAALLCIRQGMHVETVAMSRLILEQIAWISAIYQLSSDFDEYTKLNPQSCISKLKKFQMLGPFTAD